MNGMKMKSKIVVGLIVLCLIFSLTACGNKLSGTYASTGLISQTFTFDGNNVTMFAFGINASGTYKIDGDSIIITYNLFGSEQSMTQSFKKDGSTIYIGGTAFNKK